MLYPFVVVGLKSTFFEEDCHQQREPDVIRYLVRLYDISLEGNGSKSQQNITTTHLFNKYDIVVLLALIDIFQCLNNFSMFEGYAWARE